MAADPDGILIRTIQSLSRTLTRFAARMTAGGDRWRSVRGHPPPDRVTMLDLFFIAGGLAFFAASAGYAALCERL